MRRMLVSRISRRVLAEHHIALSSSLTTQAADSPDEPHVGIIFTGLNVKRSIEKCTRLLSERPLDNEEALGSTEWPKVVVDGHVDTHFAYIREHLEYGSLL
jgi:pyruvate dehydrogenase kinase 2/3/4